MKILNVKQLISNDWQHGLEDVNLLRFQKAKMKEYMAKELAELILDENLEERDMGVIGHELSLSVIIITKDEADLLAKIQNGGEL